MKIYSLISLFTLIITSTVFSQWQWISPQPTGNRLNFSHFYSPVTGVIFSSKGEVFKTTNGGIDWESLGRDIQKSNIIELKFLNNNTGYLLTRERLFKTLDGGESWFTLNSAGYSGFNGIHFNDIANFWVVGDNGLIIHTTDDGLSWLDFSLSTSRANTTIYFLDDSIGFIGREFFTSLKTTDGGQSWNTIQTPGHMLINKYFFINSDTGFAIGSYGKIFRTTNKGQEWQNISPYSVQKFKSSFVTNNNTILIFSTSGQIAKSTDIGENWELISIGNYNNDFFSNINFVNDSVFYIVGSYGNIFKTIDCGQSWIRLTKGLENSIRDIWFINRNNGWILSLDGIFKTTDGGISWTQQTFDTSYFALKKLFMVDEQVGYAVGEKIIKTTNGGIEWNTILEDGNTYYTCFFLNSEKGVVAGQYGKIIMTSDGGINFSTISDSGGSLLVSMFFVNENIGFIGGGGGTLLKTTDGGVNWLNIQFNDNYIDGIFFWDASNGCIVSVDKIYKTTDGGLSWNNTYTDPVSDWFMDIDFLNEQIGVAVSTSGNILTSNDGGTTWTENRNVTDNLLGISSAQDSLVWICGSVGKILFSTIDEITSLDNDSMIYEFSSYRLFQNYPNPFNPKTTISYEINSAGFVSLIVYDLLGREIKTLVNEEKMPGKYTINFIGDNLSSGIYFYQLRINNYVENKKMILLK